MLSRSLNHQLVWIVSGLPFALFVPVILCLVFPVEFLSNPSKGSRNQQNQGEEGE